jgi:hypothetical protein|tara:strand:+ start:262 stop:687 length:426 start_codon:yes stop_codon:yes gene_type:complete
MNIIKVLIHGNRDYIKVFRFLKHYHMDIDYLDEYDGRELDYNLIITNNTFLDSLKNYNGLIFNVSINGNDFSVKKNVANLVLNFKYNNEDELIQQFIKNPKWNFYYNSIEKSNVKFIYELLSTCNSYNKIEYDEIKFYKIE